MENSNWKSEMKKMFTKEEIKKTLKGAGERLLTLFYMLLAIGFVGFCQTETQFKTIMTMIFEEKNWTLIMILFFGFVIFCQIIEALLKGFFWIIKTIIKLIVAGCSAKKNGA